VVSVSEGLRMYDVHILSHKCRMKKMHFPTASLVVSRNRWLLGIARLPWQTANWEFAVQPQARVGIQPGSID